MHKKAMSDIPIKNIIEALLFTSDKPILIEQIKSIFDGVEPSRIRSILEKLKSEYEQDKRGIRLEEVAGGFQFITAPEYAPFIKKFYKQRIRRRLSSSALETLAIIAYKQPITKLQIESLRNVDATAIIQGLLEKDLIKIVGRKDAPGRPFVYGTTRQFLEFFGLKSLEELPKMEEFSRAVPHNIEGEKNEPHNLASGNQ
ncbi:MAG: SMC-Scp complex subunit ScpB [Candidatus Omnitrophica bacterium]|nr:SMC-Scp complex subunit ScpB [Candidatus Omnitrophota bacterium]MCM8771207.1 SMC-Scp complex subunit ScpB [Candidatus Omnitrophota bacterium]